MLACTSAVVWVQRIIWVVLTIFSASVLYVVFSGGLVDDDVATEQERKAAADRGARPAGSGEMAYDRFLPGGRQNPPPGAPNTP